MWLMAVRLTLGGLAMLEYTSRGWRGGKVNLGCMSQQWLAEHRAGSR